MKKIITALALASIGVTSLAHSASFDCSKAQSFAEKTICSDPKLSNSDDILKKVYNVAKSVSHNQQGFAQLAKELWNDRVKCKDYNCINNWYNYAFLIYDAVIKTNSTEYIDKKQIVNAQPELNSDFNHRFVEKYECRDVRNGQLVVISDYGDRFEIFTKDMGHFKSGIVVPQPNGSKTGINASGSESYVVSPSSIYLIQYGDSYSIGGVDCKRRND
ncbi:hypothetical protein DNX92_05205 [Salmonella enterica subsp. enterica]|nr:hypothetical protein [Salmonella enterica subsp. enterica serovar Richmond]